MDEAKQELKDIVEFLRDPEKFKALGAKLPKGLQPSLSRHQLDYKYSYEAL